MDQYFEIRPGVYRKGVDGSFIPTDLRNRHYQQMMLDIEASKAVLARYAGSQYELDDLKTSLITEIGRVFNQIAADNGTPSSLAEMEVYSKIISALPTIPEILEKLIANHVVAKAAIAYIDSLCIKDIEAMKDYDANVEPKWVR